MSVVPQVLVMSQGIRRAAYLMTGAVAVVVAVLLGGFSWQLLGVFLAPDLPLMLGGGADLRRGQLNPKAVPFYNATHRLAGPSLLAAIALISGGGHGSSLDVLAAAAVWAAHIFLDRGLGYGLRTAEGFQR